MAGVVRTGRLRRAPEGFLAPWIPIHGVPGVLLKIWAFFRLQSVHRPGSLDDCGISYSFNCLCYHPEQLCWDVFLHHCGFLAHRSRRTSPVFIFSKLFIRRPFRSLPRHSA